MKKLFALLLSLSMLVTLAACGGGAGGSSAPGSEPASQPSSAAPADDSDSTDAGGDKPALKVGMAWAILDDGQTNLTNAIKAALDANPDYDIEYNLTNADGDISKLIDDVESQIAMSPDVIFIMNSVGNEGIIPAIDACVAEGIPVGIGIDVEGANYDYIYEGFNHYACGQMQAEYMVSVYDESAQYNVALVTGDAGNTSGQERTQGFRENFVDVYDNATVVAEGEGDFSTDVTQALVDDWLVAHPEINVIVCVNDDEAQGAINACKAAGRDDVTILGIDGMDLGQKNIAAGDQACSVKISFEKVAQASADTMVLAATGQLNTRDVRLTTENLELLTA